MVQLGMNTNYGSQIGLTAPNGLWERKSHKNYIKCCQIEWGATPVDGIAGKNTWASLLSSRGNTASSATAFDTSTRLTLLHRNIVLSQICQLVLPVI
ncbi:hypothetical protein [Lachnotalea glycerini]|uniref:Peptidoglycan binding-like domain-containing protein n=1 Tax=Lachnotalea glycerini TaxID=1763509 RepID=A0A371JBD8_9FIRM|nr:hypothetical protein [Lachnotalea glycerini]RDY29988.1 hypothetical protein CG710_017020 [Lachnotalea glycerini]